MGHLSGLIVLHDSLHCIAERPLQFTDSLVRACQKAGLYLPEGTYTDIGVGNHCNAATLFHSGHADVHIPWLVGGNTARRLPATKPFMYGGYVAPEIVNEEVLRDMADAMGFRLVKKPKK